MRGGWLHTGDVGRLDQDGYLYVVDRLKDLIIRGGINVYPRDVEDVMMHPPGRGRGGGRRKAGRRSTARRSSRSCNCAPGATAEPADLIEFAARHISAAKYPREVRLVDAIPLTSVLKTDRKLLRAMLTSDRAEGGGAPGALTEEPPTIP